MQIRALRAVGLLAAAAAVLGPTLPALAAPAGMRSGHAPAAHRWVDHDSDQWGGWSDPANPGFATNLQGCDPIDPAQCMLPYPNDWFTRPDPTSATGRRLDLDPLAMPRNVTGKPVDPTAWNASDGFSPGSELLTVVPGMTRNADLGRSGLPTDLDLAANDAGGLGVVLLDTATGETVPTWSEVDQYTAEAGVVPAGTTAPVQQDLVIHPAVNLQDGHRYVVALRHLVTDDGSPARPSPAFETYVGDYLHGTRGTDPRIAHMDGVFADLAEAGWRVSSSPRDLYLAWDFTTASSQNATGRLVAIRDNAFEQLGETRAQVDAGVVAGRAPAYTVSSVTSFTPQQNADVAREIDGSFTVPCYIFPSCSPPVKCGMISGSPFDDCPSPGVFSSTDPADPDATPSQVPGQTYTADFTCVVGRRDFETGVPMRPVEYGHGLFGSRSEVTASPQEEMADRQGMVYCATDWFGFADSDVPNAVLALSDLSNFPVLVDRTEQGELNFLYLQRLLVSPTGFVANAAFRFADGRPLLDLSDGVSYEGNSQGGIYGGTVCAVSVDVRRCALGVPGMDYPLLLPRSTDYVASATLTQVLAEEGGQLVSDPSGFSPTAAYGDVGYSNIFDFFYPDQAQRQLVLDLLSSLWDRADPDGYATHMTYTAVGGPLRDCTGLGPVPVARVARACPVATPDHHVLLQVAWGDHQVADMTAFDEARTIGAAAVGTPGPSGRLGGGEALLASRLCSSEPDGNAVDDPVDGNYCYRPDSPLWGLTPIQRYPYDGSAIVLFDGGPDGASPYGTDPPPPSDVTQPDTKTNKDPHEGPRRSCAAQDQKGAFFDLAGQVTGYDGFVTAPPQQLTSAGSLAGPPYFDGGWQGTCALS